MQQTVVVAGALTQNTNNAEQCPGGAAQRDNNDSYQRDAPHTNTPFFSPSLAKHLPWQYLHLRVPGDAGARRPSVHVAGYLH